MLKLVKIVIIFFTVLISFINSGLCRIYSAHNSLGLQEDPYPNIRRFSFIDYFLYTNLDIGSKDKINPAKFEKFLQKIRSWQYINNNEVISKYLQIRFYSILKDPTFIIKVFSPPDICFPFNYFW